MMVNKRGGLDPQLFLELAEKAGAICSLDLESTGLRGDYNSILVFTIKPYGKKPTTYMVERPGNDRSLVVKVRDALQEFPVWISYYGRGFDIPMLQTRLLNHNASPIEKALHLDLYWILKTHLLTARRSQAHLLEWLGTPEKKMSLSADLWNQVLSNPERGLGVLRRRCESDCAGLEALYDRTKHLIREVKR